MNDKNPENNESAIDDGAGWHSAEKFGFRLLFIYFTLLLVEIPVSIIPILGGNLLSLWHKLVTPIISAYSTYVLHYPFSQITNFNRGFDTAYLYIELSFNLFLATIFSIVWTVCDKKSTNYRRLYDWSRFILRTYLGVALLMYGCCKLIPVQFGSLGMNRLLQTFGEASPMGLLWTFMSASPAYTVFTGVAEIIPGILLLFSRTTTLGALLAVAVFINVFMLNMSYDVPVKVHSFHYLMVAVILTLPDARNLLNFFLSNRAVVAYRPRTLFKSVTGNRIILGIQILIATVGTSLLLLFSYSQFKKTQIVLQDDYYGIWTVSQFKADGKILPETDLSRWTSLVFEYPQNCSIKSADGEEYWLNRRMMPGSSNLELFGGQGYADKYNMRVRLLDDKHLQISGKEGSREIFATLEKIGDEKLLLIKRGFHWVNDVPYNR